MVPMILKSGYSLEAQLDIMIEFVVADKSNNGGHALSHNGCHSSTGSTELGNPRSPKIMIGSRMIFVMAPQSCEVMLKIVLPVEVSTLSKKISAKIPNEKS